MKKYILILFLAIFINLGAQEEDSSDWIVEVRLRNGSTIKGVVLADRFVEKPSFGRYYVMVYGFSVPELGIGETWFIKKPPKDSGIKLWFVKNSPGFIFIYYEDIFTLKKERKLTKDDRKKMEDAIKRKIRKSKEESEKYKQMQLEKHKMLELEKQKKLKAQREKASLLAKEKEDIAKKMPPEARALLEKFPTTEWNKEKYDSIMIKLKSSLNRSVRRKITTADGTTKWVTQKGAAFGGASPEEREFVKNFDKWLMAVNMEKHNLELLEKAKDKILKEKKEEPKKVTDNILDVKIKEEDLWGTSDNEKIEKTEKKEEKIEEKQTKKMDIQTAMRLLLYAKEPKKKIECANYLAELKDKADIAVNSLRLALKDSSPEVRRAAIYALVKMKKPTKKILEILSTTLEFSGDVTLRREVAKVISEFGKDAHSIIDSMIIGLGDEDPVVRYRLLRTIEKIGADQTFQDIQRYLYDTNLAVKIACCYALLTFSDSKEYIQKWVQKPFLEGLYYKSKSLQFQLYHKDIEIQTLAAKGLEELGQPDIIPELKEFLVSSRNSEIKVIVENMIKKLTSKPQEEKEKQKEENSTKTEEDYTDNYEEKYGEGF